LEIKSLQFTLAAQQYKMLRHSAKLTNNYRAFSVLARARFPDTEQGFKQKEQAQKMANQQSGNVQGKTITGEWHKEFQDPKQAEEKPKSFDENLDKNLKDRDQGYQRTNPSAGGTSFVKET
jgi:hypothetical protein